MRSLEAIPAGADRLTETRFIRPFRSITNADVPAVGGKNASLGEMYRALTPAGIEIPNGFAVTADAYREVVAPASGRLHEILDGIDPGDLRDFAERAQQAQAVVAALPLPDELAAAVAGGYRELEAQYGANTSVAVRSSATAEDLPTASFAGAHESFLNVSGERMVIEAYRACLASLFTERAIHYRIDQGFDHFKVALSVGVMKMVRSDMASSGVAFTLDTETGFRDVVFITGAYGLGEKIVQGTVDPDEFYVHKPTYEAGFRAVLRRRLGAKASKLLFAEGTQLRATTRSVGTPETERKRFCLTDDEVLELAGYCIKVEQHYSALAGRSMPMDVEWAKDGVDGQIYLVQARPETAASQRTANVIDEYRLETNVRPAVTGRAVGSAAAAGPVRVVRSNDDLARFQHGEVLVAETTTPDWEPVMKTAAAIVTDRGGRTCHAAIVARELGIPAVVGTGYATTALQNVAEATVSCAQGEEGRVYAERIPFERLQVDVGELPAPPVKVMLTLGDPGSAFARSALPNDGVGLVRIEFIVSDEIQVHPMALLHPERVHDAAASAKIRELVGSEEPSEYFVRKLSEGVGTIAAAFYPKPVVVRMSDFKSNEYAQLLGGDAFEPVESNPMIGLRGASRYTHPIYAEGFALECAAMKRVRETMGMRNVILMIPFCRRVGEAARTIDRMGELGLRRGEDGLQVYVMCEIPNNVVLIDAFSQYFDGFSIGSNDLAQLTLGVDRDSELVAPEFDERDPGVLEMLRQTVVGAHRNNRHVGICGQAPSDYPEVAQFLVSLGIDSISLNPDSVLPTLRRFARSNEGAPLRSP
ncbi:MAG TPA: phosphoenolpyruvate synthase [Candidatus Tumulicola sp.]|nr:phosphoenolpyruvate synthase [Candidatus Tumulicola sp.]